MGLRRERGSPRFPSRHVCCRWEGEGSGHARQLPRKEPGHRWQARWPREVPAPKPHTPSTDGSLCPCEAVVLHVAAPWGHGKGLGTGMRGRRVCGGEKALGLVQGPARGLTA